VIVVTTSVTLVPLEERSPEIAAVRAIEVARSDKLRRHAEGRLAWDGSRAGGEEALRAWYTAEVAPKLSDVARTEIARAIGVSRVYARDIARGKVPHQRHFEALAALAWVEVAAGSPRIEARGSSTARSI
jgi:hypothetical protein